MENWVGLVISGVILVLSGLGIKFLWPFIKESWIYQHAKRIVDEMEETFGSGTGTIKFNAAFDLLQKWLDERGIKVDVVTIERIIRSAVGALHNEQGKPNSNKLDNSIVNLRLEEIGVENVKAE